MTYDRETADRLRECLAPEPEVTEKAMFGGLAFLLGGHLAVAASGSGGLMVRCAPAEVEALVALPHVGRLLMRGRETAGWLRVEPPAYESDDDLAAWVARGVAQARALDRPGAGTRRVGRARRAGTSSP